jgi:hypothetical protein
MVESKSKEQSECEEKHKAEKTVKLVERQKQENF